MSNLPDARSNSGDSRSGRSDAVHKRMLTATAIAALLIGGSAAAAAATAAAATAATARGASASPRPALPPHAVTGSFARSPRPDRADREKIQTAARLRTTALARHRTARFRAFAAELGLRVLVSIHPLRPGRCATAVIYLYNNLLDLDNAYPGENWNPLRRAVAREPSTRACAPAATDTHDA